MIQTAADVFDVRAAEAVHEVGDVDDLGKSFAHARVFKLLEKRAGKTQVQPRHVPILIEHPRDAVVAPEDLLGFPRLGGIVERHQIAERLVQMQSERVEDFRHKLVFKTQEN